MEEEIVKQSVSDDILHSLLSSGNYSDCIIRCGGKTWKVHRFVLCKQSSFFQAALEGRFKEAIEGVVDLSREDPETLGNLIDAMYGLKTTINSADSLTIAQLYGLAHRLAVDSVVDLLDESALSEFIAGSFEVEESDLWTVVKIAYEDITDVQNELRQSVVRATAVNMTDSGYGNLVVNMKGVSQSQGAFIVDVMKEAARRRYRLNP